MACLFGQNNINKEVDFLLLKIDNGAIEIDNTTPAGISKIFKLDDIDTTNMSKEFVYNSYHLDQSFTFYNQKLNVIAYNSFYNDNAHEEAKLASEVLRDHLLIKLGVPDYPDEDLFTNWSKTNYQISFNIFNDGYSLYISSYKENLNVMALDTLCSPDFYALKDDLINKIVTNIDNGKIKIGKTTKAEIKTLTGDANNFTYYYDGMNVSGYYSYADDLLTGFSFNYFYTCNDAMNLLSLDKSELTTSISDLFNIEGKKEGSNYEGVTWEIDGQTLKQSNFNDGYAYYLSSNNEYINEVETICSPNFYTLKEDLFDKLISNIENGKIKIGKTTQEEIASLTGDINNFIYDYNGMSVNGYFTYNAGILKSFSLNYYYTCDLAKESLSMDKAEIGSSISAKLNIEGKKDNSVEDSGLIWSLNGQILKQYNFSDGFAIYFNE